MNGRQFLGSFQLPVAMTGAGLAALGYRKLVTLPPPGRGGLFGPGIAILFLALVIWIGLFGLPLGLLIPQAGGYGIEFTSAQRRLLGWTVITVTIGPLVGIVLAFVTPWIVVVRRILQRHSTNRQKLRMTIMLL